MSTNAEMSADRHSELTEILSERLSEAAGLKDRVTMGRCARALVDLDEGHYGLCFHCHDKISVGRLRALPFTEICKDCEERRSLRQQQTQAVSGRSRDDQFGELFSGRSTQ